ncbi:DEAD/DEAH box helicase [Desulfonatronovibrio magnus]|uniref:DEAD/DEAH box helicase n=1 Tax=Desulfonatronovibrio magnus TaxID=698827 RepID=UPI000A5F49A0|nr:helicase-related protein [Desulfonatronovibrio magnus]
MMDFPWQYSTIHNCPCKIIEKQTLWGQDICRVWLPSQDAVVKLPCSALSPLDSGIVPELQSQYISYIASAARISQLLEGNSDDHKGHVLLAPMESNVIPLPHQIQALSKAISQDRIRYLLADEVGLGKTIEAGLVMRELKIRGLVRRTLVVSPKGIATQWVAEMQTHFNEQFRLVLGEDISSLQRLNLGSDLAASPWSMFDQVVVSLDSVKPVFKRQGWSQERIKTYNQSRFESLITAGWDLIIVDEAHRLGGSTDQVARHKLGRGLAEAAPYILLLSATPHQGKTDSFHRLVKLLDQDAFPDMESITRERVAPYVIRTEKRKAIDADGRPLFKPRQTSLAQIEWQSRHRRQHLLYEEVTEYVREGYNQALREKKRHIGFLMILMQRLMVSSTMAIRSTLERRLEAIRHGQRQAVLRLGKMEADLDNGEDHESLYDMDAQELLDELLMSHVSALQDEGRQVERLLDIARQCEQEGPDAKAEALIEWIYKLQAEENEPDLKVLIFTEFIPTQEMIREFLEARGISVVTLNGSMDMHQRRQAQENFMHHARVMVSTDAGGEGLNLQFCHVIINYDIPWNPMRLEQRIGRVDRIGQPKTVRAVNFVFKDSVEFRVREVLEQKLDVIFKEFGIDKTGDVLDSAQAGEIFEDVFTTAIIEPDRLESNAEQALDRVRDEIRRIRQESALYGLSEEPDVQTAHQLRFHPLPYWVERMTISYLNTHGGKAEKRKKHWNLAWPDGLKQNRCVFQSREAEGIDDSTLISLEDTRIRGLVMKLPLFAPGQPVPRISLTGLPMSVTGLWGLYEILLSAMYPVQSSGPGGMSMPTRQKAVASVFLSHEGKVFLPTARHIWDTLITTDPVYEGAMDQPESADAFESLSQAIKEAGREFFDDLKQKHLSSLVKEEERGKTAFEYRKKAIARIGLPEVRQYRQSKCNVEELKWKEQLKSAREVVPEIRALMITEIVQEAGHE